MYILAHISFPVPTSMLVLQTPCSTTRHTAFLINIENEVWFPLVVHKQHHKNVKFHRSFYARRQQQVERMADSE
jgi:hypothetical protein